MAAIRNLNSVFGSTKTRTFFIFIVILLVIAVGVAVTNLHETVNPPPPSRVTQVPPNIQNIPGGETTEVYRGLQVSRNQAVVARAERDGTSAIPTITGTFKPLPPVSSVADTTADNATTSQSQQQNSRQPQSNQNGLSASQMQALALDATPGLGIVDELGQPLTPEDIRNKHREIQASITNQAKRLINQWSQVPAQKLTQGDYKSLADLAKAEANSGGGSALANGQFADVAAQTPAVAKVGDMAYAVLTTAVNSVDTNAPVLARVVAGKLRGARIVGRVRLTEDKTRTILQFYSMSLPSQPRSISIDAIAVNPDNGRAGLATSINKHYLKRYGALFGSAFMSGYSQAISQQGTTVVNRGDNTTETTRPKLSGREEFFVGLGKVGDVWGNQLNRIFNTPPTVKVKSGVGLGILFLSDVTIKQ